MFVVDESVYLAHAGVKGMKWGKRKQKKLETRKTNKSRNLKLAGASIAIGAAFVSALLAKNGDKKPYDYGYKITTRDIGPSGLSGILGKSVIDNF